MRGLLRAAVPRAGMWPGSVPACTHPVPAMAAVPPDLFDYRLEEPGDAPMAEALVDRAFGPGRHVLTAYRLREESSAVAGLGWIGLRDGVLVGTVRFWPVMIGEAPALLLGPLAIDPAIRNMGCGLGLMRRGLERARTAGHRLVILVGDPPYYARAGFAPVPIGQMTLPGPVDARRILYVELVAGSLSGAHGRVRRPSV
jgi:predicted N-acetyltransferase YhbS